MVSLNQASLERAAPGKMRCGRVIHWTGEEVKRGQEILSISSSPWRGEGRSLAGEKPGSSPRPGKEKPRPPRRPEAVHSRLEPNLSRVFLPPVPLVASPLLPFPSTTPTCAGAVGTRAYPCPRGAATMAEPEQAGSSFAPGWRPSPVPAASPPQPGPCPHPGGPLLRPPHPFFRSTSRIFP